MSSMQAVPEADAGPNAYLVKDVEEWMTDDEESFVFLLSRPRSRLPQVAGCNVRIGNLLYFNQLASIALLKKA